MRQRNVTRFFKSLFFRFNDDDVMALGGQLAYSLLLAFFPFLIFLMTVIGFSTINSEDVLSTLRSVLPLEAYNLMHRTVIEVVDTKHVNLLSFSFIFTIVSASGGFNAVIKCINMAYDEREKRPFWKVQLISFIATLCFIFIILITFILLVFEKIISEYILINFGMTFFTFWFWDLIKNLIFLLALLFTFAALYHFTPCRKLSWTDVFPGAIFSTVGWIAASFGFSYYVNNFGNYSQVYGSLGAVIVLMTWLFITSVILLLGGEINAILYFEIENNAINKKKL